MYSLVRWDIVWDSKPEHQTLCESHIGDAGWANKTQTKEWVNKWEFWLLLLPLSSLASLYWKKFSFLSILLIMAKVSIPAFQIHFLTIQVPFFVENLFILNALLSRVYIPHEQESALRVRAEGWPISICFSALTFCFRLEKELTTFNKVEKIKITLIPAILRL